MNILKTILGMILLCVLPLGAQSVTPKSNDQPWKQLAFLLGKWTGVAAEKDTPHGAGEGDYSFELELNQKVIVRRNQAAYTSGVSHEDLMVIYIDPPNGTPRAIFFDTEGNVIRYNIAFPATDCVTFESDGSQPGPHFRLSYKLNGRSLDGTFEIAAGAEYKPYLAWTSKKK